MNVTRYDKNGQISDYGEFVKMEDVEPLVDFLYEIMTSNLDIVVDLLCDHGENVLKKWRGI